MKILLVAPAAARYRVTEESNIPAPRKMLRFSLLSLTTVAACTPTGHEIALCDENVEPLPLATDADVVGITFMTSLAPRAYEIADHFRKRGKIVVAGGYHPTFMTAEALDHFDAVVAGEAEEAWPRLLEDLAQGRLRRVYRGAGCGGPGRSPLPRRDLQFKNRKHYGTIFAVQAGRGCIHKCEFCSVTAFHQGRYRMRSADDVIDEVRTLPKRFIFVDDNLVADREATTALFQRMVPLKKQWFAQVPITLADDPDLLDLAARAGCIGVFVGLESLSRENLTEMGKDFNPSDRYRALIARFHEQGIGVQAAVIVGFDHDDAATFSHTLAFLDACGADALQLSILTPLPGTPLFSRFEKEGRIASHDWSLYDYRHCVIRPVRMSAADLQAGADWLYREFYSLDRIARRFVRAFFTLGPTASILQLRVGLTYRRDNIREGIVGCDPAARALALTPKRVFGRTVSADGRMAA